VTNSNIFTNDVSSASFRYKDSKIIDHVTINEIVYPILDVSNNKITFK
jgi:hypothetical protein